MKPGTYRDTEKTSVYILVYEMYNVRRKHSICKSRIEWNYIKKVFSVYDILYLDLFKNILIDVYILTCECPFWLLSYFNWSYKTII